MDCKHTITQGRNGESGSWCNACGEKVFSVDDRECKDCAFAKKLIDGWVCNKHLMAISPGMKVTYKISDGTCWTPSNAEFRMAHAASSREIAPATPC